MQNHSILQKYNKIITESKPILEQYDLCDYCLGRFFIKKTNFLSVKKLGRKIRNSVNAKDTVNFIGNRIGCYLILKGLHQGKKAREAGLIQEEIDGLMSRPI